MTRRRCDNCGSPLGSNYAFCGECGKITKVGFKILTQREKIRQILLHLDLAFQSRKLSQQAYDAQKAKYLEKLAKIQERLPVEFAETIPPTPKATSSAALIPRKRLKGKVKEPVIYANPPRLPWHGIVWYLAATGILVFVSVFLLWRLIGEGYETVWLEKWYLFAFSLTGPAIYLTWMYRNDKFEREPLYFLVLILGWGAFSAFLSFIGNGIFDEIGLGMPWLGAPIVEESLKAMGVYWMAKHSEFNDSLDGMVYGFASGVGFAWMENFFYIVYVYEGDPTVSLLRVFVFSYGHGLYTAFTGRALGITKVKRGYVKPNDLAPGLILAMVAHGWYNCGLIPIYDIASLAIWLMVTDGLFTLLLYYFVRESWKQERLWLYDQGYAPK